MLESQVSFPQAAVPRRWSIGQPSYAKVNSSNNSIMAPYIDSDLRVPEVSQTRRGRRRLCVAVSVVLLVLLVASVTVVGTAVGVSRSRKNTGAVGLKKGNATLASSLAPAPAPAPQSYYNALAPIPGTVDNLVLDQLCSSTMYPQLCSEIFDAIPGAQKGDLQQWTEMVMQMSEQAVNESVSLALQMSHLRENHGSVALEQCIEVLMDSLDQINSSMYLVADMELHPSPATESDVQTYMSAAMTDIDTCQQGVSATALPETGWRQAIQSKVKAWMPLPVESSVEQQQVGQAGSVLAAWRSYASSTRGGSDVASVAANPSSTGRDLESAVPESLAPLLKSANNTIVGAFNSVTKGVRELPGNVQAAASFVPSRQAVMCFAIMTAAGVFFILMAFFMFLPVIVLFPQKFAISFTLGCLFIIGSFFALKGPKTQFLHMISKERLPFTAGFLGSMAATIYVSMVLHSYIFSVVCAAVQVLALLYYVLSYFPGGTAGMQFVTSLITSSVLKCFGR